MFTGIVEEVGTPARPRTCASAAPCSKSSAPVLDGTAVGDSIATSGVCLTVTRLRAGALLRRRHARDGAAHDAGGASGPATGSTSSAR